MQIEEFVKQSLLQIMAGVSGASSDWSAGAVKRGKVNPPPSRDMQMSSAGMASLSNVDFDLSVVVSEAASKEGGAKISVWGMGVGGAGSSGSERTQTSRIKFSVPVELP